MQLPRWPVFFYGGVMSHTELRRASVTVVWLTQRWLIVLLTVITSETPGRQILLPPNPSHPHSFHPPSNYPFFFFFHSSTQFPFRSKLPIDWCPVNGSHQNNHWAFQTAPRRWIKDCWSVSLRQYFSEHWTLSLRDLIPLRLNCLSISDGHSSCKSGMQGRPSHQ